MAPLADFLVSVLPVSLPRHLVQYVPGETPLSTTPVVVGALISYLVVIFGIQAVMTNKQPIKLNTLFQLHNVILSSGSLLLLVLMLEEVIPIVWRDGFYNAICADESWTSVRVTSSGRCRSRSHPSPETRVLLYDQLLF
jgi:fatty acid elongase 3